MGNLENCYIAPETAVKKLKFARGISQTVYIYGAAGFGKTELVKQYLKNKSYIYFSCKDGIWKNDYFKKEEGEQTIVVIDDIHKLKDEEARQDVIKLAMDENVWLILIGKPPTIVWFKSVYAKIGTVIIEEDELKFSKKLIEQYLKVVGLNLSEDEINYIELVSEGNAYVLQYVIRKFIEGEHPSKALTVKIEKYYMEFIERFVIVELDTDLADFLMQISVVDEFDERLAEVVTGNNKVAELLERIVNGGNFITEMDGIYTLRYMFKKTLRNMAEKQYGHNKVKEYMYNAGLYYEINDEIKLALEMYEKSGNHSRIKELLIRNARRNPGAGYYFELRKYYFSLDEEVVEKSAVLMSGMSMLYSLLLQEEESEYWYKKLKEYADSSKGGERREALSYKIYLDISLPHRGSIDVLEILKSVPAILLDKGIDLPKFTITGNLPSTMNGGKDFCQWSLKDRELASSLGWLLEKIFGKYGKGLVKVALAESLYEKGAEAFELIPLLSQAQMEAEMGGTMEIEFVAAGFLTKLNILNGQENTARISLKSFENKIEQNGAQKLLPNLKAMECSLALYRGDKKEVEKWLKTAPDEDKEFFVMERLRYLTKIRCYIFMGEYIKAFSLLEKLKYYVQKCQRTYIGIECGILGAIIKYRMGIDGWKEDLREAMVEASFYHFVRIISFEGVAVMELLEKVKKEYLADDEIDKKWFQQVLNETGKIAVYYPNYLKGQIINLSKFSENALAILRLQAEGMTNYEISEKLNLTMENVKYHTKQNYKKLGVSGKAEAVIAAKNLGII